MGSLWLSRQSSCPHEAGEDVRRERGTREPSSRIDVLQLLDELEHRRAGPDLRRDDGDRVIAHAASALHHLELIG